MTRRTKRPYGTGYLKKEGRNWVIRWRETEIGPDGSKCRILHYESLGPVTRTEAAKALAQKLAVSAENVSTRSRMTFATLAVEWKATVLPMYKHSTQKNHLQILEKHLTPRFGETELSQITRREIQAYVAHLARKEYAPKTIDHIHDVLSAVLRTAVKWGHLGTNPAQGVDLPPLKTVRPKFALTSQQASSLLSVLPPLVKTLVGLDLLTGLRRGELFALRWKHVGWEERCLKIEEAVYEGKFGTPKTAAGTRQVPLSAVALQLLREWLEQSTTGPEDLVFCTRSGLPIAPNNLIRRFIFPACDKVGLPRVTWLTFRRTYSSWAHDIGVPGKVTAQLMGHANVYTTLNTYTQVMDASLRVAADRIGEELFGIVQSEVEESLLTH